MVCKRHEFMNRIKALKGLTVLVLLMIFLAVSLTAEAFILTHREHTHDFRGFGGSCATCAQVKYAESLARQFSTSLISTLFLLIQLISAAAVISIVYYRFEVQTLVKMKTRMDC